MSFVKNDKGVVINTDIDSLKNYKQQREQLKKQKALYDEITNLKTRVDELEKLVKKLMEK